MGFSSLALLIDGRVAPDLDNSELLARAATALDTPALLAVRGGP